LVARKRAEDLSRVVHVVVFEDPIQISVCLEEDDHVEDALVAIVS
jgi:hypothetical protein